MKNPWIVSALASSLLAASPLVSAAPQEHQLSANFGVASNYIWRGVTQNNDRVAASGGVDYAHKSGGYAGIWTSSLDGGNYELDLYGGYRGSFSDIDYDAGLIMYQYPVGSAAQDITEIYLNMDFTILTAQLAITVDKDGTSQDNDIYLGVGTSLEIKKDVNLELSAGMYEIDDASGEDYVHARAAISKGEYTFALDKNDKSGDAGDMRFSVAWTHAFDL